MRSCDPQLSDINMTMELLNKYSSTKEIIPIINQRKYTKPIPHALPSILDKLEDRCKRYSEKKKLTEKDAFKSTVIALDTEEVIKYPSVLRY